jgi:hypothetical protein
MQQLRDSLTMKSLFSYAIKTAAMWMKESGELSENDKIEIAFLKVCLVSAFYYEMFSKRLMYSSFLQKSKIT